MRVFISYAHASPEHIQAVARLGRLLGSCCIAARLDSTPVGERPDWPLWILNEFTLADHVLVVVSALYRQRAEAIAEPDGSRGVRYEAALIRDDVYRHPEWARQKYLPVTQTVEDRYHFHDLIRAYAAELAAATDSEQDRRAALSSLFDHYLATAAAAMDALHPPEHAPSPRAATPASPIPPVADPAAARVWLDTERATLVAVAGFTAGATGFAGAAGGGWPDHTVRLAATLYRDLETRGHYPDALALHSHARQAARDLGDRAAEADALTNLGGIYRRQGRYEQAADHLQQALALFGRLSKPTGEARARAASAASTGGRATTRGPPSSTGRPSCSIGRPATGWARPTR